MVGRNLFVLLVKCFNAAVIRKYGSDLCVDGFSAVPARSIVAGHLWRGDAQS